MRIGRQVILDLCLFLPSGLLAQAGQNAVSAISDALRGHDFRGALSLCQTALAQDPNDYRIWTLRGMATAGGGHPSEALLNYQHALRLAPEYLPALEGTAETEFQLGKQDAEPLLEKILTRQPDDPTTHALLAILEYRRKDCADAIGHFARARAAIVGEPSALTDYGSCLAREGQDGEAIGVFRDALAIDPVKPEARYNLALAQWDAHLGDDALNSLEPLMDAVPANQDALSLAADIYESKNDTVNAVTMLRKALETDPNDTGIYLQFAALSFDHASPQVGVDMLNVGLKQMPREPRLYLARGILLTQFGKFTEASDDFVTASRLEPKLEFLGVALGLVNSQEHNTPAALHQFRAAVKAHPNEAYAHYLLSEALLEQGKKQGSAEYREELYEANRAVELDPKLTAAHDLLATIYIENGNANLAVRHSRIALLTDPDDQQAIYHLVIALRKANEKDEIPALLKRLVELRSKSKNSEQPSRRYRLYVQPDGSSAQP